MSRKIILLILLLLLILSGYSEAWEANPYNCFECGKVLLVREGDKLRPTSDKELIVFELNNKSKMNIQLCSVCKEGLREEDYKSIMQAVIDSWEYEITILNNWTEEQQQDYRDRFYNLEIIKRVK